MLAGGDAEFLEEMRLESVPGQSPRGGESPFQLFRGELSNRFNAPVQPQGGITTALAIQAADRVLQRDDLQVRSLTTVFAGQVPAGPVEVEVEVLRQGRSASQVRATVRPSQGDRGGHVVVATFAATRDAVIGFDEARAPQAGPPDDYVDRWEAESPDHPDIVGPRPTFFDHFEARAVTGHMPWDPPWDPTTSELIGWMRWRDTPTDGSGAISPLALIPPCDTMPGAVFERHGKDDRWFLVPSVDLTIQLFSTELDPDGWLLRRNVSRWAGGGLAQADMELYSRDGRPLAFATQLMHVRLADAGAVQRRMTENGAAGPDS